MTFKLTELIVVCIKVIQGDTVIPVIIYGTVPRIFDSLYLNMKVWPNGSVGRTLACTVRPPWEMLKLIGICPVPKSVLDPDPTYSAVLELTLKEDK